MENLTLDEVILIIDKHLDETRKRYDALDKEVEERYGTDDHWGEASSELFELRDKLDGREDALLVLRDEFYEMRKPDTV